MNKNEKLKIAKQLSKLNVDIIEAGFPISSADDFEAVKLIAQEVRKPIIAGLARCRKEDIDRAWEALKFAARPRIHVFLATSPIHMKYKLGKSPKEIINIGLNHVRYAKSLTSDIEFSPEDASRTKKDFLFEIIEGVIDAGATTINIPDTVGYAMSTEFGRLIKDIRENVRNINKATISVHCHNDLGLGVANSLEAVRNGARQVECTINGIGERAGNASLEEFVMALRTRKDFFNCKTSVNTKEIYKTSRLVSMLTGISAQPNKAIVGKNAFAHEAGIHQQGVISNRRTYEIMDAKMVGRESEIVIGKHSGKHAIEKALKNFGYKPNKEQLFKIVSRIKSIGEKQKIVEEEDILAIADDVIGLEREKAVNLEEVSVLTGNKVTTTATVRLKIDKEIKTCFGTGVGPVDAVAKAIESVVKPPVKLKEFDLKAITGGTDALAHVSIRVEDKNGRIFQAAAVHQDIIMASAQAFVRGINKAIEYKKKINGGINEKINGKINEK